LNERSSGYWYAEEWADDLNADCDDWNSMLFEITAAGDGTTEEAVIRP
jgi:hypothetical protein